MDICLKDIKVKIRNLSMMNEQNYWGKLSTFMDKTINKTVQNLAKVAVLFWFLSNESLSIHYTYLFFLLKLKTNLFQNLPNLVAYIIDE